MIVPRTAIDDFVSDDWVACFDRHARRTQRLWFISHQEAPLFAVTAFGRLENSLCPRQGEAYDAGGLK